MVAGNRGTKGRRGVENEGVGFGHPKAFPRGLLDLGLSRNDGGIRGDRPIGSDVEGEVGGRGVANIDALTLSLVLRKIDI